MKMRKLLLCLLFTNFIIGGLVSCNVVETNKSVAPLNAGVAIKGARSLYVNETLQLEYVTSGDSFEVDWFSSNSDVLQVSSTGLLTAKKAGEASIKVQSKTYENISNSVDIKVLDYDSEYFNVTFKNYDGTILYQDAVLASQKATYKGETPYRVSSDLYNYTFDGWDLSLDSPIYKDTVFTAKFKQEAIDFNSFSYSVYAGEGQYQGKYLVKYSGPDRFIKLPTSYNYKEVIGVAAQGLYGNTFLRLVDIPSSYVVIGAQAFEGCTMLENAVLPQNLLVLGERAFYGCSSLKEMTVPSKVTTIYDGTFFNCAKLAKVSLPDTITSIGANAFKGSNNIVLEGDKLPSSLQTIGESAFDGCKNIKGELVLPEGVTKIDSYAFSGTNITSITIPSKTTSLQANAFLACRELKEVTVDPNNGSFASDSGCLYNKDFSTLLYIPSGSEADFTIKEGCKTIASYSGALIKANSVSLPSSITSVEANAFYVNTAKAITFSKDTDGSKLTLGQSAFDTSTGITSITIPNGVSELPSYIFKGCSSLQTINLPDSIATVGDYAFSNTGIKSFTLPKYMRVVGSDLFYGSNLESIIFPSGVEEIGGAVVESCQNLTSVTFEDVSKIKSFDGRVFAYTPLLKTVSEFPVVEKATGDAFVEFPYGTFYYSGIESFEVPEGYSAIGNYAFSNASNLKTITLPSSLKRINKWAFESTGLTHINFRGTKAQFDELIKVETNTSRPGIDNEVSVDDETKGSYQIIKRLYDTNQITYEYGK